MISIRQFTNLLIIGLCISIISCAEKDVETQAENILEDLNIDSSTSLDSILSKVANHYDMPGITASVASQESVIEVGAYGTIDTRTNEPLTKDKIFDINSVTKSFTTLILMQLVEEGTLSLDDEITTIFPEFLDNMHEAYKNVKVIDFAKHRSGLSRNGDHVVDVEKPILRGSLVNKRYQYTRWILQQESNKSIGEYVYSNSGYIVLGSIIEQLTRKSYERNVLERIYFPLSLYSSGFGWPVDFKQDYTYGHMRNEDGAFPVRFTMTYLDRLEYSSGGIHLSNRDLTTYAREHLLGLNGRSQLLSKESFEKTHEIEGSCGLGWYASVFDSYPGTEVGGIGDGYISEVFISSTEDLCIVVLANINDENSWIACKVIELALLNKYSKDL